MTSRRRLILAGAISAGVIALVLVFLAMLPTRPSALKVQFDRVEKGMTRAEVEAILGKPSAELDVLGGPADRTVFMWSHADGSHGVSIRFDDDNVHDKQFHPSTETFTDRLPRWLGMGNRAGPSRHL